VADLGIAPSEARKMTVGEIYAVIWAKTRDSRLAQQEEQNKDMYELLQKIKGNKNVDKG